MIRKRILILGTAMLIGLSSTIPTLAETAPSITMENSGAYLFTWRPVDYGNGQSFAILVGGNTINESDVILNRGYDYGYTFQPNKYSRPWGQVPDLVNAGGVWAITGHLFLKEYNRPPALFCLRTIKIIQAMSVMLMLCICQTEFLLLSCLLRSENILLMWTDQMQEHMTEP